ncbi:MAG: PSD1 domain-containing protein [Planctomycetes bacterium]|nr:PSD1 domain-containing protein [Planctomycetota bacterium]
MVGRLYYFLIVLGVLSAAQSVTADDLPREKLRFFESKVRPLLIERCIKCHGEKKQEGKLRLDLRVTALKGGESGSAIHPGDPSKSLLIEAVNYESLEMPPTGKLSDSEIAVLTTWVKIGAPWPESYAELVQPRNKKITDEDRAFWAFQPVGEVSVPSIESSWCRNPIDRFVLRRLQKEGLAPAAPADRIALLRRVYFDLIGLPPNPQEVERFLNDKSPNAYERLVDELLKSPQYGERWARHWLDLVRYAESDGYKQDAYRPDAWRYRDYVIRSFNKDKPYDQFVMEQLAGDEIAPGDPEAIIATGYLRHWIYEYNQRDVRTQWDGILNDVTDVTGDVFLGMGMGCARCHDHKFDPILQKDYYRLRAFFAPMLPREDLPLGSREQLAEYHAKKAEWEKQTTEIRHEIDEIERPHRERVARPAIDKFPPDIRPMVRKPASERTPLEQQLAELVYRQVREEYKKLNVGSKLKGDEKKRYESLKKQLAEFDRLKPAALPPAVTVTDVGPIAPVTFIPGSRDRQDIKPGYLTVLDPSDAKIQSPPMASQSTGRRTALARWITSRDNPLSTRVIVNRIWQYHFGRGLVATSSDFGRLGEPPSHPELLDWLTTYFLDDDWRFKRLHRLIMTSAAYRQSALREMPQVARLKDPTNRLLWKFNSRRLDAEQRRMFEYIIARMHEREDLLRDLTEESK